MRKFYQHTRDQRGVTLIELLAVIIILGIIAAIAAPVILNNMEDSKDKADKQTQAVIEEAAKRFVLDQLKTKKKDDIDYAKTNVLNGPAPALDLSDYLQLDNTGQIKSAADPTKYFNVAITNGKVTVTVE